MRAQCASDADFSVTLIHAIRDDAENSEQRKKQRKECKRREQRCNRSRLLRVPCDQFPEGVRFRRREPRIRLRDGASNGGAEGRRRERTASYDRLDEIRGSLACRDVELAARRFLQIRSLVSRDAYDRARFRTRSVPTRRSDAHTERIAILAVETRTLLIDDGDRARSAGVVIAESPSAQNRNAERAEILR